MSLNVIGFGNLFIIPEHLFRGDGTGAAAAAAAASGGSVTTMGSVGGGMRRVMMGRAGRPLDDGVARAGWTVVAAMLTTMMTASGAGRFEVLGLVAAAGAASQVVRTAATPAQEVRGTASGGTAASPLQLLQLGTVVFRAASHASSAGDRSSFGHTCQPSRDSDH